MQMNHAHQPHMHMIGKSHDQSYDKKVTSGSFRGLGIGRGEIFVPFDFNAYIFKIAPCHLCVYMYIYGIHQKLCTSQYQYCGCS